MLMFLEDTVGSPGGGLGHDHGFSDIIHLKN